MRSGLQRILARRATLRRIVRVVWQRRIFSGTQRE